MEKFSEKDFVNIIMNNDEEKLNNFLLIYGKNPKPISPIYYLKDYSKEMEV